MSTLTLLNPQTAASAGERSLLLETDAYDNVVLIAQGLTAAEVVTVQIVTPSGLVQYSEAGAAANLTATQPHLTVPPGPTYVLNKPLTAGPVALYAALDA